MCFSIFPKQRPPSWSDTRKHTAAHYTTLQQIAAHCNTLQHTSTHCICVTCLAFRRQRMLWASKQRAPSCSVTSRRPAQSRAIWCGCARCSGAAKVSPSSCRCLLCITRHLCTLRASRDRWVAVWCSVVQCGAVSCSVVQCGAVWCSVVQCGAVCCSSAARASPSSCRCLLCMTRHLCTSEASRDRCVEECCSVLQCVAVCCSVLQCVSVCVVRVYMSVSEVQTWVHCLLCITRHVCTSEASCDSLYVER